MSLSFRIPTNVRFGSISFFLGLALLVGLNFVSSEAFAQRYRNSGVRTTRGYVKGGYRKNLVRGTYFGPHRTFTGHRSLHQGRHSYSPHTYGTYGFGPYRHSSAYTRHSSSYSFSSGGGYYGPYSHSYSRYSHSSHHGYSSGFGGYGYHSRGYRYGHRYRGRHYHGGYRRSSYGSSYHHGVGGYYARAFVLHGNRTWLATQSYGNRYGRENFPAWREAMEAAVEAGVFDQKQESKDELQTLRRTPKKGRIEIHPRPSGSSNNSQAPSSLKKILPRKQQTRIQPKLPKESEPRRLTRA